MTTTIAPQPEYASRSTALSSVSEMVSNRLSGELHKYHQMSKAGYSQHSAMKYEQETTPTDQAPTTPRPYRTASRMRCRRRQSPTSSTVSSVRSTQVEMRRGKVKTTSYLRPVDTPNQIRARDERLIPPLRLLSTCRTLSFTSFRRRCRRHLSSTRHRYRLQSRHDRGGQRS
jgi:AraC-like DNA-binding protein